MRGILVDPYQRTINYLRLSLTERCNFNCFYCHSEFADCHKLTPKSYLTREEAGIIAQAAIELGLTRIHLTGGEPLLHPDILDIITHISRLEGVDDLSMTTNAFYLESMAFNLANAGLHRVNISLDSLDEKNYRQITQKGILQKVLNGIKKSLEA